MAEQQGGASNRGALVDGGTLTNTGTGPLTPRLIEAALTTFFAGRTIGYSRYDGGWVWRGPGYDEGWAVATADELAELHRLIAADQHTRLRP